MIDLHTHLLHGVDDGPSSLDEALELARALSADGVRRAAATPHVSEAYPSTVSLLDSRLVELRAAIERAGVELDVVSGAEIEAAQAGRLDDPALRGLGLGGSAWLLVETPLDVYPFGMPELVGELGARGHRVVLSHPERNTHVQDGDLPLVQMIGAGAIGQVTAASLSGRFGRRAAATGWRLLESGLGHLVASDAHGIRSRGPALAAARSALERRLGPAAAEALTESVPRAVLAGATRQEVTCLWGPAARPRRSPARWRR